MFADLNDCLESCKFNCLHIQGNLEGPAELCMCEDVNPHFYINKVEVFGAWLT